MDSQLLKKLALLSLVIVPVAACGGDDSGDDGNADTTGGDDDDDDSADDDGTVTLTTTVSTTDAETTDAETTDPGDTTDAETTDAETTVADTTVADTTEGTTTDTDTGVSECVQVMITADLVSADMEASETTGIFRLTGEFVGDAMLRDMFRVEFWDAETGVFDLSMAPNDNFATCTHCVRMLEDFDFDAGEVTREYYQSQGSIDIDAASDLSGTSFSATFTGVRLVEVTIDEETAESTPVPDGGCIDVVDATITGTAVPEEWTCPVGYFSDLTCDCGCAIVDPDCVDETATSCLFCNSPGSCSDMECPGTIDPANNAVCEA